MSESESDWDLIVMEDGETFGPAGGAVFATVTDDVYFDLCEGGPFQGWVFARGGAGIKRRINLEAVPDMLEALRDVIDQLDAIGIPEWHGAEGLCLKQAREAIEKAHVESPADQIGWDQ